MVSASTELVAELVPVLAYAIAGGLLTIGGVVAEYTSVQHLGAGDTTVALWLAGIGLVMLYAGVYGIGYRKVLARAMAR
ncbi:hypothetical protein ACFQGT_12825 [Natrialbaceae archaeon GCM10025810]|uniref:hypothetical protein n=1 Tax=Halovalidus salilacus TaxID=3075124 RepID=UPI0036090C00